MIWKTRQQEKNNLKTFTLYIFLCKPFARAHQIVSGAQQSNRVTDEHEIVTGVREIVSGAEM